MNRNRIEYIIWWNGEHYQKASKEIEQLAIRDQIELLSDLHEIGSQRNFDNIAWQNLLKQKCDELACKL